MQRMIRLTVLVLMSLSILLPGSYGLGQAEPIEAALFRELISRFNLPALGKPEEKVRETDAYHLTVRRFTGGDTFLDGSRSFFYKQHYLKAIRGGGADCRSNLLVKTAQLSKLPEEDRKKLISEAGSGFSGTINRMLAENPGLKQNQQTIGESTIHILSGSATAPGASKDHPGFDVSFETASAFWTRGDWIFIVTREIDKESGGGGACGAEFQPVPELMEWVEAIYSISDEVGMFAGAEQPAPDLIYPSSADCTVGIHPNYPFVVTIKLNYPGKPAASQVDTVRLVWEGYTHEGLERQIFQDKPSYHPDYLETEWTRFRNNDYWVITEGVLKIPLRFNLLLLPYAITPDRPYRTQVSIYGLANAQDKYYSNKLGTCDIVIDYLAVIHDIRTGKGGFVQRYSQAYLPPWEKITGPTLLYPDEVLQVGENTDFYLLYVDGTRAYIHTKPRQDPFTMTITIARPEEKLYTLLTFVLAKGAEESLEEGAERGIKFLVQKAASKAAGYINPAVSFVFFADDVLDAGKYSFRQLPTRKKAVIRVEETEDGARFARFSDEPAQETGLRELGWAQLDLFNLPAPSKLEKIILPSAAEPAETMVEVVKNGSTWDFRGLQGSPLVTTADDRTSTLKPGQALITNRDATLARIEEFDPQSLERWWESSRVNPPAAIDDGETFLLPENDGKLPASPIRLPTGASISPGLAVLGVALPGVFCFGISFLVLMVGIFKRDRKITAGGMVLILGVICVAGAIGAYIAFSTWQKEKETRPVTALPAAVDGDPQKEMDTDQGIEALPPEPAENTPPQSQLSQDGPWLILPAEDGIWAMNQDGSGLSQVFKGYLAGPADFPAAVSPGGAEIAFITASSPDSFQDLTLMLLTLPEGRIETITRLTSPDSEPAPEMEICAPNYEAARAATIGNGLAWSPDGSKLAFTASLDGPTADVYLYVLQNGSITRLSDEPGQAYDLHWNPLPESDTVVYFSASCFGTGAGFDMEGAWMTRLGTGEAEMVYQPSTESRGEVFIAWAFGKEAYFAASVSGCPYRDLRMVDLAAKASTALFDGCFEDVAVSPTSSLAVLASSDFSDRPGLYLYAEPAIPSLQPVYVPEENGRKVQHISTEIFLSALGPEGMTIRSVGWDGQPGQYQGRGEFPFISKNGEAWLWNESGAFYLRTQAMDAPLKLGNNHAVYPIWYEDLRPSGEIVQRLLFSDEQNNLYLVSSPDYQPVLQASDLKLLSTPAIDYP